LSECEKSFVYEEQKITFSSEMEHHFFPSSLQSPLEIVKSFFPLRLPFFFRRCSPPDDAAPPISVAETFFLYGIFTSATP